MRGSDTCEAPDTACVHSKVRQVKREDVCVCWDKGELETWVSELYAHPTWSFRVVGGRTHTHTHKHTHTFPEPSVFEPVLPTMAPSTRSLSRRHSTPASSGQPDAEDNGEPTPKVARTEPLLGSQIPSTQPRGSKWYGSDGDSADKLRMPDMGLLLQGSSEEATKNILKCIDQLDVDGLAENIPKCLGEDFERILVQPQKPQDIDLGAKGNSFAKLFEGGNDGKFDMQGVVGKYWQEAKKADPDLLKRYEAVGRGYSEQRRFRAEWAREQYEHIVKEKSFSKRSVVMDTTGGQYEPFDIIVDREGGPARSSSIRAATHYVLRCMQMHRHGQAAAPGTPWLKFNGMTARVEFLYLKRGYQSTFEAAWTTVQKQMASATEETLLCL